MVREGGGCIVFDVNLYGFCRYVRRRLEVLGFRVYCFSSIHEAVLRFLGDMGCIVVTVDVYGARGPGPKVKLPYTIRAQSGRLKRRLYEEWWTLLARCLHEMRTREVRVCDARRWVNTPV